MSENPQNILRFWRNVEIFNLPDLDKDALPLSASTLLPWENKEPLENEENVWRYTFYIGKVAKSKVVDYLVSLAGEHDADEWMEPVTGDTCLAAIILDENGRPNWNSYVQASYVHGIHCLSKRKSLAKINELLSGVQADFEKHFKIDAKNAVPDGNTVRKGKVVTKKLLDKEIGRLKKFLGRAFSFEEDIYWTSKEVPPDSENDLSILNSFYLDDLNYLIDHPANYGKALKEYLQPDVNADARQDMIAEKAALLKCLNPTLLSPGRWPSPISYGLYTAQQGSVNATLSDLKNSAGIRGINGPPGTGKTTLLQDIIADIIVSRAEILIETDITGIFHKKGNAIEKENGYKYYYYNIAKEELFDGYGIVVSSNNNKAVENISKELPALDKVDRQLLGDGGYFAACASRLLEKRQSWGILSASLGNSKNRYAFKRNVWDSHGMFRGLNDFLYEVYKDRDNDQTYQHINSFEKTKSELKDLLLTFRGFQQETGRFHTSIFPSSRQESGFLSHLLKGKQDKKKNNIPTKKMLEENFGLDAANIIDEQFLQKEHAQIHLSTPYSSETINELRSRILLKSLELHQYAILSNAKYFKNNLSLFMEMLTGKTKVPDDTATTLWNTFFFCIPVVSTTLASAGRLFRHLSRESIGWLLLDEAGQATPQSAAGIIWRSRRCIIVGDPLQIQPVITHPPALIKILRQDSNITSLVWSPLASSVQSLADRVSKRGTYLGEGETKSWAGFPLRTHRRCDDPMFTIANKIAYEEQMVKAQKDQSFECALGKSCWFDIAGYQLVGKHAIQEEIDLLKQKIAELTLSGYMKDIYVISPFTSVAFACDKIFKKQKNVKCGTIHTFQGQEAEIVFLILGSDPAKTPARNWVTQSPNMVNVALTRAKRRFYMIGNKKLWGHLPFINQFKNLLPAVDVKRANISGSNTNA